MSTRTRRALALVLAICTGALVACQQSDDRRPREEATSDTAGAGTRVPAGEYEKVITVDDVRALGLRPSAEELELAPDGTQTITLTFADSYWSMSADYNGDDPQVGAYGTIDYEEDAQAYVIDEPCCGSSRFTWELEGKELSITMDVDYLLEQHPALRPRSREVLVGKLAVAGTFTRVA